MPDVRINGIAYFIAAVCDAGDHVVLPNDLYGGTYRLADKVLKRWGLEYDLVDQTDLDALAAAVREDTKLIWVETPTNPLLRMVDIEGYVALNSNRYSVPLEWIGRRVEVRETRDKIEIQLDARRLVTHRRIAEAEHQRVMLAEHRPPRGQRTSRPDPHPEEQTIATVAPELADYIAGLKQHSRKAITLALRQLLRLVREYPREPLVGAVKEAARYGLYDLDRLERMILRRVTREYFLLEGESGDD